MGKGNLCFYFGKKVLIFLISVLLLSVAVFCLSRLAPGDPLVSYYGEGAEKMSPAEKTAARERLGLTAPIHIQYFRWAKNALKGDWGISFRYKQGVMEVIGSRIGNTLLLGGLGFLLTFLGAMGLGLLCARYEGSLADRLLCKLGTIISSIPEFWLSLILILVFSVGLGWLPGSGAYDVVRKGDLLNRLTHLILPLMVVLLQHLWYYAYLIRSKLLEVLREDYVRFAYAKGLSKKKILFRHCLPNALPTYISLMALSVPHILGGTYIVETVFSYPGLGTLSFESARYHDYNLLMVLCLLSGILVILCSTVGRILNEHIDPRLKTETREVGSLW